MKKLILYIVIVIFCGKLLYSQDNIQYFAEEGTIWSVGNFGANPNYPHKTYYLQMRGDTIINDKTYHVIWQNESMLSEQVIGEIYSFVRVDTDKKVYLRALDAEEHIIFDYNLELNDVVALYAYNGSSFYEAENVIVIDVEYKEYSGVLRKTWVLSDYENSYAYSVWIDGLGNTDGMGWVNWGLYVGWCGRDDNVLCSWLNDDQIYDSPAYSFCEYRLPSYYNRISLFAADRTLFSTLATDMEGNVVSCSNVKIFDNTGNYTSSQEPPDNYFHMLWINNLNPSFGPAIPEMLISCWEDSLLYMGPTNNPYNLVFDYKSLVGDALYLTAYSYHYDTFVNVNAFVTDVGTIITSGGIERKSWEISNENGSTRWTIGLGNSEGILSPNWNLTGIDTLDVNMLCAWFEGEIYDNPEFDSCSYAVDPPEPIQPLDTLNYGLYPTLCEDVLNICMPASSYYVYIYDTYGRERIYFYSAENNCEIDMSSLKSGMYYIKIRTREGVIPSKFLKL